jgi:predicted nucleic acid-binding protein
VILADTSVWIGHFREPNSRLQELLFDDQILIHPMVIGEIACGNLSKRDHTLLLLQSLPGAKVGEHDEVLRVLERQRLWGKGLGWVDLHLLTSTLLTGCRLWTLDRRLDAVGAHMKISS